MKQIDQITKRALTDLRPKARDILVRRFGLGKAKNRETLESIGQSYGITRERVRQIESAAMDRVLDRHGDELGEAFGFMGREISARAGVVREDSFLEDLSEGNAKVANHLYFLLCLGREFKKLREDDDFFHRWTNDSQKADIVHNALHAIHKNLSHEALFSDNEILKMTKTAMAEHGADDNLSRESLAALLGLSKKIGKNAIGEWGHKSSPHISPRGMRDLAHIVLRRHGEPMHFTAIAGAIESHLGERAHVQTVHNELIKDQNFVLVGRGLYALASMGYKSGVVADVIKQIIQSRGPMTKEEILKEVLKEREVKEGTVLVNLQNKKYFKRLSDSTYILV